MAAWHGHANAVSLLVSKGADVNLKDKVCIHSLLTIAIGIINLHWTVAFKISSNVCIMARECINCKVAD